MKVKSVPMIINEDDSHFFYFRPPEKMTVEGLHEFIDQYASTHVSHLFLNPNAQRASYRSDVWESAWDDRKAIEEASVNNRDGVDPWITNLRLLDEKGLDPYSIWIARCREKGISPWLSMRMNDSHFNEDISHFIHSTFWKNHPEYWRYPDTSRCGRNTDRSFNYAIKEVRDYHMSLVEELLNRYDPDGLELDWMRFGFHFLPGHELEGGEILLDFMRKVRRLTQEWSAKRKHPVQLAVRVPTHPETARGLGLDGIKWAKEGLIDMLIPTPFWETADFDIPIELWRELLGNAAKKVVIAAGLELRIQPCPWPAKAIKSNFDIFCGFTATMLDRGADAIYLFNHMDNDWDSNSYNRLINQPISVDAIGRNTRRNVVTFQDTQAPGVERAQPLPAVLWDLSPAQFRIHIGPKPKTGHVIIRVGLENGEDKTGIQYVHINSYSCSAIEDYGNVKEFVGCARVAQYEAPLNAVQHGFNVVDVFARQGYNDRIVWFELFIVP